MLINLTLILIAYLMGSISSAIIICKLWGLPNPREQGSGNPGATNVLRLGGKTPAVIVLMADVLKGIIPVALAKLLQADALILGGVTAAAVMGHLYPVFFGFKGGKGVATSAGAVFTLSPVLGMCLLMVWLIVASIWRYSSLASLVAALVAPVIAVWLLPALILPSILLITCLIFARHYENIQRLRLGIENKLGSSRS